MIHNILEIVAENLNQYLGNRYAQSKDIVEIAPLGSSGDGTNGGSRERITLTLTNIEQEKLGLRSHSHLLSLPIPVYLYILIAADFPENNYEEALKLISATISYFQSNTVYNHQNSSGLDSSVDKLVFEMVSLNIQELNQIWSIHGGKYMPSVVYKVKTVNIGEEGIVDQSSKLSGFGSKLF